MSDCVAATQATLFHLAHADIAWPGHTVLRDISLDIRPGEKVALLGKSGAGKSTLLQHLFRQQGEQLAFCPQYPGLVPGLSVFHNIYMGQLNRHHFFYNALNLFFPFKQALQQVAELAGEVGLADKLMVKAETLSGGQQQRVALARSLYQQQRVFLGDEPVSAVDELQAEALLQLIVSRHDTVVIALHNTRHALHYCERIIGLQDGGIVLDAPSRSLSPDVLSAFYSDSEQTTESGFPAAPLGVHPSRSVVN
jgi:phosphonate transport system ATP-binding protein